MTALEQFIRLEAQGRWREGPQDPWREVVVSFGNASLVLSDFNDHPLTHWSLAAVEIAETNGATTRYTADPGSGEVLELTDAEMIQAIATVTATIRIRNEPKRRSGLRVPLLLTLVLLAAGAAALWGPNLLRARALALVSPEQARLISVGIRDALATPPCDAPDGTRALALISGRLGVEVVVMPWEGPPVAALPDGTVLLSRQTIEAAPSAQQVASWVALGQSLAPQNTPLAHWLADRSLPDILRFLTSGQIEPRDTRRMARAMRNSQFAPGPPTATPTPMLTTDHDWVALQNICNG